MKLKATLLALTLAFPAFAQDVIAPHDQLVVEGVPPIPKSLVERVGLYTESRAASFLDWHPTRREILIATRFGEVPQVHRVVMPLGARTQLTFYPERVSDAHWRPKTGDGFVFSKDVGGGEFFQLFWRDAATGRVAMFTDGKSRNTGGAWAPSGRWMVYESTKRNGKDTDLYTVDPTNPASEKLVLQVEGGGWSGVDVSPDEKGILVHEYISANESRYWLLDLTTGQKRLLTPGTEKVAYGGAEFTQDGKKVLLTSDKGTEFAQLRLLDLAGGPEQTIKQTNWDVAAFDLSPNGEWIAYILNEAGVDRLHVMNLHTKKELPPPALPLGALGGLKFHENGRDLGFTLSAARSPADAYSIDITTGKLTRWTESETGGLDASQFSEPSLIKWKSFDGREITGFLYRPPARFTGKRPVVINIHGGPESQFQPSFLGRNNYYLNELGIAMIFPNVRGSSGFGKTFLAADNAFQREDSVKDIGALLDWIAQQPELDPARVMVMGGSYGGYMTLASLTHFNDRLRGGIDNVGISNFVTFLEKTEGYRRDLRRVEYGDERDPKMREFQLRISPTTNAHKITRPLFVIQGKNDPRVPLFEAEQMVAAVRKNGGPVWYLMAKDEGHGFSKKRNQDFQFYSTIRFFEEFLLK